MSAYRFGWSGPSLRYNAQPKCDACTCPRHCFGMHIWLIRLFLLSFQHRRQGQCACSWPGCAQQVPWLSQTARGYSRWWLLPPQPHMRPPACVMRPWWRWACSWPRRGLAGAHGRSAHAGGHSIQVTPFGPGIRAQPAGRARPRGRAAWHESTAHTQLTAGHAGTCGHGAPHGPLSQLYSDYARAV